MSTSVTVSAPDAVIAAAAPSEELSEVAEGNASDPDYVISRRISKEKLDLTHVAEAADACDVGARTVSKIVSSFAVAAGHDVITKGKVQRALDKSRREKVQSVSNSTSQCSTVFCDGRDDRTLREEVRDDGSKRLVWCTVHNVSVNMHPGDICIEHFTCEGRHTGEATAKQLCAFLRERGIYLNKVRVVGGDGTAQVVGWKSG